MRASIKEQSDFDRPEATLAATIKPIGPLQLIHFREIVAATWRLQAISRHQTRTFPSSDALLDPANEAELQRIERHITHATRAIARASKALQYLQTQEQVHDHQIMMMQKLNPTIPEHVLRPSAFTDVAKAYRDTQSLPSFSPEPPASADPRNIGFMQMVNEMVPGMFPGGKFPNSNLPPRK